MSEISLKRSRVMALISKRVAASVPEHVRVRFPTGRAALQSPSWTRRWMGNALWSSL